MNQEQYVMIVRCIQHGAPVIADELISSLNALISQVKSYEKKEKKATKESEKQK